MITNKNNNKNNDNNNKNNDDNNNKMTHSGARGARRAGTCPKNAPRPRAQESILQEIHQRGNQS